MAHDQTAKQSPLASSSATRSRTETQYRHDDGTRVSKPKSLHRSWKKKYRKMRLDFDQKMVQCKELHNQEQRAMATIKRLAIENDRILDILLDNNNCPHVPSDKRIDISFDLGQSSATIERPSTPLPDTNGSRLNPTRSLRQLLVDVPHKSYAQLRDKPLPIILTSDLEPLEGGTYPLSFLSADDIENYIKEIELRAQSDNTKPTIAPATIVPASRKVTDANGSGANGLSASASTASLHNDGLGASVTTSATARDFALKNPVSMHNWLRKHAPSTLLQEADGETPDAEASSKKPRTGRADKTGHGKGTGRSGNRTSLAVAAATTTRINKDADEWDADARAEEAGFATPVAARGKRKRADDDAGYRPKGGSGSSSRPSKKKRKTDGGDGVATPAGGGTPSGGGKKTKKEKEAAAATKNG